MSDVAERILMLVQQAILRKIDAPTHYVLPIVIARGEPHDLRHPIRWRVVVIDCRVRNTNSHGALGAADMTGDVLAQASAHIRNCSVMAAPRLLVSVMNSLMNSCS